MFFSSYLSITTTHGPLLRRLLFRFHAVQNSASSGLITIAGPMLKKWPVPVENLGSVHLSGFAVGKGHLFEPVFVLHKSRFHLHQLVPLLENILQG